MGKKVLKHEKWVRGIPDLIYERKGPWEEFENNFEEGWGGEPDVFCLANPKHHREVANLAAYNLSKKYSDQFDLYNHNDWESIAQKAYNEAAHELYPNERLWSGDNNDNPAFWHETLKYSSQTERMQLWKTEEWGPYDLFDEEKADEMFQRTMDEEWMGIVNGFKRKYEEFKKKHPSWKGGKSIDIIINHQ